MDAVSDIPAGRVLERRGRAFHVADHPHVLTAAEGFTSGTRDGMLRFFDAALPRCRRLVDFGAFLGFAALYAAGSVGSVFAYEPSPKNFALLSENVAWNGNLSARIHLFRHGVADRDDDVTLFGRTAGDPGASIYPPIERGALLAGAPQCQVTVRDVCAVLQEIGLDAQTLVKVDIVGAEYLVLPAMARLIATHRPYLYVSFQPYNLAPSADEYLCTIARLRGAMQVAEAVAPYRYMYLWSNGHWLPIAVEDRMDFLRQYLLRPKSVPWAATPQYGFNDTMAFSDEALPGLGNP